MKRTLILSVGLLALMSTSAFATPHFAAVDADGDGAYVAGMDVNGDSAIDHKDIGVKASEYDCDDSSANKSPLIDEIYEDGLDNDCDAATADTLPMTEPERARFASVEYGGNWNPATFAIEHKRCTAGAAATPATCKVDGVNGRFEVLLPDDVVFVDIFKGDTQIIRKDGVRELVTVTQFENAKHVLEAASRPVYRGPSKAKRQEEAREVASEVVEAEKEERLEWQARQEDWNAERERRDSDQDSVINDLLVADDVLGSAILEEAEIREAEIAAEREAREAADAELANEQTRLAAEQDDIREDVEKNAATGFAINAGVVGGGHFQRTLTADSETLRGPAAGAVGFDVTAHLDLDDALVGAYGNAMWGSDGSGSGADEFYSLGFEALGDVKDSGHHVGGFVGYQHKEEHANFLDVAVPADGACTGVSYRYQAPSAGHITVSPFARVGVCGEVYGSKGWQDNADGGQDLVVERGSGFGGTATVGLSFSATSVSSRSGN